MSLIVACPNCQTRYNLPLKFEGKKVKCKSCGKPFSASVGAARVKGGAQKQQAVQKVQTDPDELAKMGIGTIRQAADPFAAPAHMGPDPLRNHVVQDPGFGMPSVSDSPTTTGHGSTDDSDAVDNGIDDVVNNPYIQTLPKPSASGRRPSKRGKKGSFAPTKASFGNVFGLAFDTWKTNLGFLLGVTLLVMGVSIGLGMGQGFLVGFLQESAGEQVAGTVSFVTGVVLNIIQAFLAIGQTQIVFKLLRGKDAEVGDLFTGGDLIGAVIVSQLIAFVAMAAGFALLVVPALLLALYFWPFYHVIVDRKGGMFDSFKVGLSIASVNVGTTFLIGLVLMSLAVLGGVALGAILYFGAAAGATLVVGITTAVILGVCMLFFIPLFNMIWGAAYLMMSGQVGPQH